MILLLLLAIFSIVAFLYYSKRARSGEIIPPDKQANLPLIERFILLCSKNIEKSILNAGKKYGPVVRMSMGLNQ
ncbi:unnamed protein product [Allacma fusca]|uniref:Uncharacterized protein n=1 Tax=Allacma fusca TaxID=39272 RepID=A0A8J2JI98_9HEXA|nr:unnamed protein product [Allacma fusca]